MDRYEQRFHQNSSFSSNVLDAIYRSIDKGNTAGEEAGADMVIYQEAVIRKKHSFSSSSSGLKADQKWVEQKMGEKSFPRRNTTTHFEHGFLNSRRNVQEPTFLHSGTSSSESSESEPAIVRPKPARTGSTVERALALHSLQRKTQLPEIHASKGRYDLSQQKQNFCKSKSTFSSSKAYGDVKKPKQPISPGARLAGFLNSLFTATGNGKKTTKSSSFERKSKSDRSSSSTCSSASSYSRSCLSKTPSSKGGNSLKSVRFDPVSVIVDEDCRPCGQKCIYERGPDLGHLSIGKKSGESPPLVFGEELKRHLMEKNRQVEEAAKNLLKGYQKKSEFLGEVIRDVHENVIDDEDEEEEDDDDDGMSCSSSDLFELENLAVVGIDRYREELPVYETTRLDTNRAIANGLIR